MTTSALILFLFSKLEAVPKKFGTEKSNRYLKNIVPKKVQEPASEKFGTEIKYRYRKKSGTVTLWRVLNPGDGRGAERRHARVDFGPLMTFHGISKYRKHN